MLTLEFLRFIAWYILAGVSLKLLAYFLLKRNPDSSVAGALTVFTP